MSIPRPDPAHSIDIDAAELDLDAPVEPVATADEAAYVDGDASLGGTGGQDAGGAG